MSDGARILVVAATARELATPDGWHTLLCGVGPVEAAARTAAAIAERRPDAIVHVGIAGARRARALAPASLVIAAEARYCDSNVPSEWAPSTVQASPALLHAVQRALPNAPTLTIGTSARVGGTVHCDVEAMEGFGVLRAAQLAGVPAIEVRAISNDIEEHDRARWHFDAAFTAVTAVTPQLVRAVREALINRSANA
jgi:futalosine hydrolase